MHGQGRPVVLARAARVVDHPSVVYVSCLFAAQLICFLRQLALVLPDRIRALELLVFVDEIFSIDLVVLCADFV